MIYLEKSDPTTASQPGRQGLLEKIPWQIL